MRHVRPHKSSFGDTSANGVSILCYLCVILFWTIGLVPVLALYFTEKRSRLVKFHALQAVLLWVMGYMAGGGITFEAFAALLTGESAYMNNPLGWSAPLEVLLFRLGVSALVVFLAVVGIVYAYRWQCWRIPLLGHIAWAVVKNCALPGAEKAAPAAPGIDEQAPPAVAAVAAAPITPTAITAMQANANAQLPPDMRDQPPRGSIDEAGVYVKEKKNAPRRKP